MSGEVLMVSRAKSSLAVALQVHGEAIEQVEQLYLEQAGEVTEGTEQAEQSRDLAAGELLEQLARYRQWTTDQREAIAREVARLGRLDAEMISRADWADARMADLVRAQDPAAKSKRAGTRVVKLRDHYSVRASPGLVLAELPPSWLREVSAVPARPARPALDKARAKKDLRAGWRTGEPPGPGWYEVAVGSSLRDVVYLYPGAMSGRWRAAFKVKDGRPYGGHDLDWHGFTIKARPRLEQLQWRHHAPGVELRCRVGVTVV